MMCLTIWQPWADLICPPIEGIPGLVLPGRLRLPKDIENRSWFTDFRGDLLIHAGRTVDWAARVRFGLRQNEFVSGAIIGKVLLTGCSRYSTSPWHQDGMFAWRLARPERLRNPVEWKGRRGLFEVPAAAIGATWGSVVAGPAWDANGKEGLDGSDFLTLALANEWEKLEHTPDDV